MSEKTKPRLRRLSLFHRTYEKLPILVLNTKIYTIIYSIRSILLLIHEKFRRIREMKRRASIEKQRASSKFSRGDIIGIVFLQLAKEKGMKVFHRTYKRSPILVLNAKIYTTIYSIRSILLLIHEKFRQIWEIKRRTSIEKQRASSTKFAREDFIDIVSFREPKGMKVFHRTYGRSLNS